jgi:hypothetical protein
MVYARQQSVSHTYPSTTSTLPYTNLYSISTQSPSVGLTALQGRDMMLHNEEMYGEGRSTRGLSACDSRMVAMSFTGVDTGFCVSNN